MEYEEGYYNTSGEASCRVMLLAHSMRGRWRPVRSVNAANFETLGAAQFRQRFLPEATI
jgi:hypothetical protein